MATIDLRFMSARELLLTLPDNSVDSIVTDSPYGLSKEPDMVEVLKHWLNGDDYVHASKGFMGKNWDSFVPGPLIWKEALRVLKPGGYLLSFFGSRTYDIGTLAIRLAGFEIRDQIMWIYSQGFPKSLNLDDEHEGKGTGLKPAHEPICVARKPLEGTVLNNVNTYGTGAINIDSCRIEFINDADIKAATWGRGTDIMGGQFVGGFAPTGKTNIEANSLGRWPSNVIHDGSNEVMGAFAAFGEKKSGNSGKTNSIRKGGNIYGSESREIGTPLIGYGDSGSIARFFYCAKANSKDRNEGLRTFKKDIISDGSPVANDTAYQRGKTLRANTCPTVKPTPLMRYLCRLVTPIGGTVIDFFMGSGTTGKAAVMEGFGFIGGDSDPDNFAIAEARINYAAAKYKRQTTLF